MDREKRETLEGLYRQYFQTVKTHAYRYLENWDLAQEAAQETFGFACRCPEKLFASPNQIGWLKKVVEYIARNMLRYRQAQQIRLLSLEELEANQLPSAEDQYKVDAADYFGDQISEDERKLLNRLFVEQQSYSTVAKELGISVDACYKRSQRLTKKLRKNKNIF